MTRKILFVISEDWVACSHFLPQIRQARDEGLIPVLATRLRAHAGELDALGIRVIPLDTGRASLNPFVALREIARMVRIFRTECPEIVHFISLRLVLFGGVAARLARVPRLVLAPVGLGYLWTGRGRLSRWAPQITRLMMRLLCARAHATFVFENDEDPDELSVRGYATAVHVIGGAGVDEEAFQSTPRLSGTGPVKAAVVARIIREKGVLEAIAATKRARALGANIQLSLFGEIDRANIGALSEDAIQEACRDGSIIWHGHTHDIRGIWASHDIALLLSYREGLPRALVEAAACGKPIVATDVTGCRQVVRHEVEGLLVPLFDIEAAAAALARLAGDEALRLKMGTAARQRFEQNFTESIVRSQIGACYRSIIASLDGELPQRPRPT